MPNRTETGNRFVERLYQNYGQEFVMDGAPLVDERSAFQSILLFDNKDMGRVLVLDNVVQLTTRDECAYSEMLVHVPALEHGTARRVLIIGGGDGAVAEEALKYDSIESVTLVDIDARVIEIAKQHLVSVHRGAFDDPRLDVIVADASHYVAQEDVAGRFDLIIADRPDPIGPGTVLFQDAFYRNCARALSAEGVAVFQTGCPHLQPGELTETLAQLARAFDRTGCYLTVVPSYIGGFMALTWGSRGVMLGAGNRVKAAERRYRESNLSTDYYSPAAHQAAFLFPRWIERLTNTG